MTWFGNSLLNLKDQITTLTKEILPEVDENVEREFDFAIILKCQFILYYLDKNVLKYFRKLKKSFAIVSHINLRKR